MQLSEPSVTTTCPAIDGLAAGARVWLRLDAVDITDGSVAFSIRWPSGDGEATHPAIAAHGSGAVD